MLAEATNNNCGIVLLMIHHNVQTKQDLELLSHEKTVEKKTEIISETVKYTLTNFNPNFEKNTFFKKIPTTKERVQHIENIRCNYCSSSLDKVE